MEQIDVILTQENLRNFVKGIWGLIRQNVEPAIVNADWNNMASSGDNARVKVCFLVLEKLKMLFPSTEKILFYFVV